MYSYRLFFKDCQNLSAMAKSQTICLSFNLERDSLESATSTFNCSEIPDNVNVGDVVGLYDPYGTIIYYGVVNAIDNLTINTSQIESLFNDNWLYWSPTQNTIETSIKNIIETDFKGSSDPIMSAKYNFNVVAETSTSGKIMSEETVLNFEQFIYSMFNSFNVRLYFDIPYSAGTPTITIANRSYPDIKIGNNVVSITSIIPTTEVEQVNKLLVYSRDNVYRATYYMTPTGSTTNASDPTRPKVVNSKFVFSDDDLDVIKANEFSFKLYNHYITFDLLLESKLYDFNNLHFGQIFDIFYNESYFKSIYTGYSLDKPENVDISYAHIKCGKVRISLTSRLMEALK